MIEAASLDLGMAIFTLLALGLAMAGQAARIERALIVACAVGSAAQNYAAADVTSPRSVAAYVAPSLFLALVVDRVVAVIRRHVLGDAERSVWATVGRALAVMARGLGLVLLYLLRFVLAPPSTGGGPAPGRAHRGAAAGSPSAGDPGRRGGPGDRAAAGDRAARAGGRKQEGPAGLVVRAGSPTTGTGPRSPRWPSGSRRRSTWARAPPGPTSARSSPTWRKAGRGVMISRFIARLIVWALALAALCGVLFYEVLHHRYVILVLFLAVRIRRCCSTGTCSAAAPRHGAGSGRCAGGSGSGSGRARGTHP